MHKIKGAAAFLVATLVTGCSYLPESVKTLPWETENELSGDYEIIERTSVLR